MSPNLEQDDEYNNCKLKFYSKREKRAPLFITEFSHGEININTPSELNFQCFRKASGEHKAEYEVSRNLVATNGRLNYVGNCNISSLRYFVGVRDKISGKMKLYDCVIFRMKPVLPMKSRHIQPMALTYSEKLNVLTENFGSKGKKRTLSQKQKYSIDETLERKLTVHNLTLQSPPNKFTNDNLLNSINYLPPINRIATSVNEVFNIRHIISSEEDSSLDLEVQEILIASLDKFTKKRFSFCKYVSMRFENVSAVKAKYLLYLNYLIVFQQLKYTNMRKKDPVPTIPDPYKKKFLEKFSTISRTNCGRTVRSCPTYLKDKLVSYILVLGLFIDGFKVILDEMVEDMCYIKLPKLTTIAQALGCYISKKRIGEQIVKYAELKIPLYVPIPKYARKSSVNKKL